MIDLMITNNKTLFKDVKAIPSVSCDSDHRMVMGKLKLQKPTMKAKRPTKRFKLENLKNQECVEQLRNRLEEKMPTEEVCDIETEWKELHKNISTIAKEVVQKSLNTQKRRQQLGGRKKLRQL